MSTQKRIIRAAALWGSLAGAAASGIGCCCHSRLDGSHISGPCADIEKGAMPPEQGAYVREFQYRQCAKAEADDFVIYLYEWTLDTADLGPFGRRHLAVASRRLTADAPFSIMIEASADPRLDEARFLTISDILGQLGVPDPASRVRIGIPSAEGLYGDEAERVFGAMFVDVAPVNAGGGYGGFGGGIGGGGFQGGAFGGAFGGGFSGFPFR